MNPLLKTIYELSDREIAQYSDNVMLGGGTRGGPVLVRGKGVRVFDRGGNDYIDCTSQSWAMYLGFVNPEINAIVAEHMENMSHIHQGFDSLPRFYLAKRLTDLAPRAINRVSFTVGGGPAIEAAMKIGYKNTQPSRDFICLNDGYHGTTLGTMGASWISTRAGGRLMGGSRFLGMTRSFIRVPQPYCYRCPIGLTYGSCSIACANVLESTIERGIAGNAAGFIVEPLQASGGQIIYPREYMQRIREICDVYSVPLIFDEIQTFARIGHFFASEYYGVDPDMIVLGKGLGAGFPIAALLISDKLDGSEPDSEELHTFANNSVSQVAAAKQLELLENGVLENCRCMGEYLKKGLEYLRREFPEMGDIRQAGLHIGIELVRDPETKEPLTDEGREVRRAGFKHGLILGLSGPRPNILKVKPPLIIKKDECDEILDKLSRSMHSVLR